MKFKDLKIGFALTGSFCTFSKTLPIIKELVKEGASVIPIMSYNAYELDTKFGKAEDFRNQIKEITGKEIIHTIQGAEPIGPKKMTDIMIIAPTTGNTIAKLTNGITDTPVTMAVKSSLRIGIPIVLALATNDALAASAQNIGKLLNNKNFYFVPMKQDDFEKKPTSIVADFTMIPTTIESALKKQQIQPILL